ncbi:MAG: hypothetical protein ACE5GA_05340 [Candidatus Zixiibacteriota bacterium]
MSKRSSFVVLTAIIFSLSLSIPQQALGRALVDRSSQPATPSLGRVEERPFVELGCHNIGNIALSVTNQGTFGKGFAGVGECLDGEPAPSTEFPKNSNIDYLFAGAFWIGGIIGRDTLVSVGADGWQNGIAELNPAGLQDQIDHGERLTIRSISDPNDPEFALALSEQDITFAYFDTLTEGVLADNFSGRPHRPLGVKIRQSSYAWSYSYAEDFVLFDYKITNIDARRTLEKVYMGIYVDGDVGHPDGQSIFTDDICGFKLDVDQLQFQNTECKFVDTIRIAWIADNDGNNESTPVGPDKTKYTAQDPIGVTGTRVVRTPSDSLEFSFNWWVSNGNASLDFGPRLRGVDGDPFRDFGGFLGTPEGDKNKYYIMRHGEFDYDQLFSAVDLSSEGWLNPGPQADNIADGFDTRYLLSFGPFTIFPGEELPITFAFVAGNDFHTDPQNMNNHFQPLRPDIYSNILSYKDFGVNAQWASWIYDNPGVDTDGDGFRGKARVCVKDSSLIDTSYDTFFADDGVTIDSIVIKDIFFTDVDSIFYEGDGVPDFLGASPPPAPIVRLEPSPGSITVRWNGLRSETTPDPFSLELDFEGYRVYTGLGNRSSDMVLASSYDRENFTRFVWNQNNQVWDIAGAPQSLIDIQDRYAGGNRDYDPIVNGIDNPLIVGDSLFYFITQDWNRDDLTDVLEIHKPEKYRYNHNPDGSIMRDSLGNPVPTPFPHTLNFDSAFTSDTFLVDPLDGDTTWYMGGELTEDGSYFKYFEYTYELTGLLASQLHFVSVTAFDFGAPASGLDALETSPLFNVVSEFPQNKSSAIAQKKLDVVVYPNPYRIDARYRERGFEARINPGALPEDRTRAVNFTNLPPKCTIRIYTLDGDLVREILHDVDASSPGSMHDQWSLVTRNTQLAASGIYYWSVEEENGRVQTGKLVLIM